MELRIVATGSHGNTYILQDKTGRMLMLDCGIAMQDIYRAVGFNAAALDICLCSSFHGDHSKAAKKMLDSFMPVSMSSLTAQNLGIPFSEPTLKIRNEGQLVHMGNWRIVPFSTFHDAAGSLGYLIENTVEGIKIAYVGESGYIKYTFPDLDVLIVECNHNLEDIDQHREDMADRYLRVRESHMSLKRLRSYLEKSPMPKLRHIVLVHLSDSNSNEEKMLEELRAQTGILVTAAREGLTVNLDKVPF